MELFLSKIFRKYLANLVSCKETAYKKIPVEDDEKVCRKSMLILLYNASFLCPWFFFWTKIPMHNRIRSNKFNMSSPCDLHNMQILIELWHKNLYQCSEIPFFCQFLDYLLLLNYFHFKRGRKRERCATFNDGFANCKKAPLTRTFLRVNALFFDFFSLSFCCFLPRKL